MRTEKEQFIEYLKQAKQKNGKHYSPGSITNYSGSVALITSDLKKHFKLEIDSLFDIVNVNQLVKLRNKWLSLGAVKRAGETGHGKDVSGFQHYINFRKFEQEEVSEIEKKNEVDEYESRTESGIKVYVSKVYERDKKLRAMAIRYHKAICFACKFDFKKTYGKLGKGFIEIHHVKPLMMNNGKTVKTNAKTDLFPLCSNCHRMVHRKRNVVLSIEALKKIIVENRKN